MVSYDPTLPRVSFSSSFSTASGVSTWEKKCACMNPMLQRIIVIKQPMFSQWSQYINYTRRVVHIYNIYKYTVLTSTFNQKLETKK